MQGSPLYYLAGFPVMSTQTYWGKWHRYLLAKIFAVSFDCSLLVLRLRRQRSRLALRDIGVLTGKSAVVVVIACAVLIGLYFLTCRGRVIFWQYINGIVGY